MLKILWYNITPNHIQKFQIRIAYPIRFQNGCAKHHLISNRDFKSNRDVKSESWHAKHPLSLIPFRNSRATGLCWPTFSVIPWLNTCHFLVCGIFSGRIQNNQDELFSSSYSVQLLVMLLRAYSPSVLDSIVAQFLGGTEFHCFSAIRDTCAQGTGACLRTNHGLSCRLT